MAQNYEMLLEIVNLSEKDKLSLIKDCYLDLMPLFREIDPQTRGLSFISEIIATAAAADDEVDPSELNIMRSVMLASDVDLSDDELKGLIRDSGDVGVRAFVVKLADYLEPELRARLVLLTACVCSLDDRITEEETDLILSMFDD